MLPPVFLHAAGPPSAAAARATPRAGQVLELAVLLAVRQGDEAAFERNYAQLRVYYRQGTSAALPCLGGGASVWHSRQLSRRLTWPP